MTCTEPLPSVVVPTMVARSLSFNDAAMTSAEDEVLPLTSTTSGLSVSTSPVAFFVVSSELFVVMRTMVPLLMK